MHVWQARFCSSLACSLTGSIATTDWFDDTVRDMFSIADTQQKGHLTREEFESVRTRYMGVQ